MNEFIGNMIYFTILYGGIAAWVTHVVMCIHDQSWVLLFAGAIIFPVGIIHGVGLWLGVF